MEATAGVAARGIVAGVLPARRAAHFDALRAIESQQRAGPPGLEAGTFDPALRHPTVRTMRAEVVAMIEELLVAKGARRHTVQPGKALQSDLKADAWDLRPWSVPGPRRTIRA